MQVVNALIVSPQGFPLAYEVMPGNTSDKTALADALPSGVRSALGLDGPLKVHGLGRAQRRYMPWHRSKIFRNSGCVHRP